MPARGNCMPRKHYILRIYQYRTFYTGVFSGYLHSMDAHDLNATEVEDFRCQCQVKVAWLAGRLGPFRWLLAGTHCEQTSQSNHGTQSVCCFPLAFLGFFMLNLKLQFSPVWGGIFPSVILACAWYLFRNPASWAHELHHWAKWDPFSRLAKKNKPTSVMSRGRGAHFLLH